MTREATKTSPSRRRIGGAQRVAAGILSSRLLGVVRVQLIANFFGVGRHADVLQAVFRGPNILQNLLGEQSLSAAFIPIYSRLLAEGRERDAGRFAGAVLGLLVAMAAAIALLGVLLAEPIVIVLSPGYLGDAAEVAAGEAEVDRLPLAVTAVRILFPMTALLVLSSWALAILNSHRRFFISYFAPVLWNAAIITTLVVFGSRLLPAGAGGAAAEVAAGRSDLLVAVCWGALIGGALQFAFQLPLAARLLRGFRFSLSRRVEGVRQAIARFGPLLAARGAVQLSAYFDLLLSSLLAAGAQAALGNAQILYLTALALFAMSVAASELPELSALAGTGKERRAAERAASALEAIAFWLVPTAIGYMALGFVLVGALFRRGAFDLAANWLVWAVLAVYSLGLLASGWSRLLGNVFFAVGDTRRPARIAIVRVLLSGALGAALMVPFDRLGVGALAGVETPLRFGAVGLVLAGALGAWLELALLTRALRRQGRALRLPFGFVGGRVLTALAALAPGAALWWLLLDARIELLGAGVLLVYAGCYMVLSLVAGVPQARAAFRRGGDRRTPAGSDGGGER